MRAVSSPPPSSGQDAEADPLRIREKCGALALVLSIFLALMLFGVLPSAHGQPVIDSFPYLETFDSTPTCADCSTGGLETDCLQIQTDLGWIQETAQDSANTNWIVWTGNAPTDGTGPKTGDHTSGSGNYLWVHQGTGAAVSVGGSGAPYCEPEPTAFVDETVGIVSPVFDFSSVAATDSVFLRFWHWMYGLRTGTLTVQMSTTASVNGSWTQNLTTVGLGPQSWQSTVVELPGVQGLPAVRLRFVAHFLPTYCPSGTFDCVYTGTSPHPDDMADQAFDDVEIFLSSNAPSLTPGTEDKAIWVDLTERLSLAGITPFATNHQGSWSDVTTVLGSHTMLTWGGLSATGEAISQVRIFDYYSRSFVFEQDTGQIPVPRERAGFVTLSGSNSSDATLAMYGGRGKFGLTPDLVLINSLTGALEGPLLTTTATTNCTDLTPGEFSHASFPSEGSRAVLDPLPGSNDTVLYVTMGRSLVVQVNFVTRYTIHPITGTCTLKALRPSEGADPPEARWNHVVGAWAGPDGNHTYLFVFGGRFQPSDADKETVFNDLRVFDVQAVEWLEEKPVADPTQKPSPRSGAAAASNRAGDKLVLFGGQNVDGDTVFSDVYVLQYDLEFELWKRLSPGLDVNSVPARAHHLMLPMFFDDRLLDPTAPSSETSEGFMVYGGQLQGGQVSNHMAKLHFGDLDLTPVDTGGGGGSDPTIAIVLGVILPFCCLFLLLLLALVVAVSILIGWRSLVKRRLKRKYGIGQDPPKQEAAGALFIGQDDVPLEDM